jgi:phosphoserine phosphatase RsbU/P
MPSIIGTTYQLHCSEIWGGNENLDCDVCTSGMTASLYSSACDGSQGGDIYYFTVCSSDSLTRVILADLRGHGEQVSQLSAWIYNALRENMETLDGAAILQSLNRTLFERGFQAITTAAIVSFYKPNSSLYFSYAGHPPALLRSRDGQTWRPLQSSSTRNRANLPLGVFPSTDYDQETIVLRSGDRLVLYTDGVTECPSETEEEFGQERLCALLEHSQEDEVGLIKRQLIAALSRHMGNSARPDDLTLMIVEIA